jgi:hypothetical protein
MLETSETGVVPTALPGADPLMKFKVPLDGEPAIVTTSALVTLYLKSLTVITWECAALVSRSPATGMVRRWSFFMGVLEDNLDGYFGD